MQRECQIFTDSKKTNIAVSLQRVRLIRLYVSVTTFLNKKYIQNKTISIHCPFKQTTTQKSLQLYYKYNVTLSAVIL